MSLVQHNVELRKHEMSLNEHEARLDKHEKKINNIKERQSKIVKIINNHEEKLLANEELSTLDILRYYLCCGCIKNKY